MPLFFMVQYIVYLLLIFLGFTYIQLSNSEGYKFLQPYRFSDESSFADYNKYPGGYGGRVVTRC